MTTQAMTAPAVPSAAMPTAPAPLPATGWLNLDQAAAYIGPRRQGIPCHRMSVRRYMREGLRGVTLRYGYRLGQIGTCAKWIDEFIAAVDAVRMRGNRPAPATPRKRQRQIDAANARNRRAGIA